MKYHLLLTDTETTGLDIDHTDEMVSMSCVPVETNDFKKFKILEDPCCWYIKPEVKIKHTLFSPDLEAEIYASQDTPETVCQSLKLYVERLQKKYHFKQLIFGGWNAHFDYRVINQFAYNIFQKYFDYHIFDAYAICQRQIMCRSLDDAAGYFGIKRKSPYHNSTEDILLTIDILNKLEEYEQKN